MDLVSRELPDVFRVVGADGRDEDGLDFDEAQHQVFMHPYGSCAGV